MRIIDIHTHIYPTPVAQKATNSIQDFYELDGGGMNGTVEMLRSRGKEAGISQFVVLPVAVLPDRTRHINEFILQQAAQHDDFIGFGTIHALQADVGEEAQYILDKGLHGIKMHPDFQHFDIDDPRLFPAYEAVSGRIPVMFHMGDPRYDYSRPARLHHLLELFPKLDVIAAHFGGYKLYEEAYAQLKDTNCIFDISSSLMFMDEGVAEEYINRYGAERMAYGTDYPLWDPVKEVQRFLQLKLSDDKKEQIAWKTAHSFLKL